jgi:hypothetical protein
MNRYDSDDTDETDIDLGRSAADLRAVARATPVPYNINDETELSSDSDSESSTIDQDMFDKPIPDIFDEIDLSETDAGTLVGHVARILPSLKLRKSQADHIIACASTHLSSCADNHSEICEGDEDKLMFEELDDTCAFIKSYGTEKETCFNAESIARTWGANKAPFNPFTLLPLESCVRQSRGPPTYRKG